uniref:Protein E7 n=1 Tax=Human papillomavirus TaxID=10566 RepID=A0A385PIK7_9PAPI|nr:MAG: E7 protein [Human papillomavirus]
MRANEPTLRDINLDLHDLVLPDNLLANESLSPDADPEEEELQPFRVDTCCGNCKTGVRLCVFATSAAVQTLQTLLFAELSLVCAGCAKGLFRHGRH